MGAAVPAWITEFTGHSASPLKELHETIYAVRAGDLRACPVSDLVWSEQDFKLMITSGTIYLEPPLEGVNAGAFFEGAATVTFDPADPTARQILDTHLNRPALVDVPIKTAYLFSLRPDSPLASLAGASTCAAGSPSRPDIYGADKTAMKHLGLGLTWTVLNRDGPTRNSTYALFPMEEIRTSGSEEARILYTSHPIEGVRLSVFGHQELAALKPYKFRFHTLARYTPAGRSAAAAKEYAIRLTLGTGAESAVQETTLRLEVPPGLRALLLEFTARMEVSAVESEGGVGLPFLQWKKADPDFDETVLVDLRALPSTASEGVRTIIVKSSGQLFEPWFSSWVLLDEDTWYPQPSWDAVSTLAQYELDLTIPARLHGIGMGEKVQEEVLRDRKHIVYRTTHPTKNATFYYGDYLTFDGMADDIKVILYQHRADTSERQNARFTLTEITNILKVFNRMLVPLEIRNLRVASTRTTHGRGFEGLLLLGAGGSEKSESSWADLFRAHEVAHEWWGHYVRPEHWPEDRWLSESFAEYSAMEYYKVRYENPRKALELMDTEWFRPLTEGTLHRETLTGEKEKVRGRTAFPLVAGTQNVYTKGPMVLHMLRYLAYQQKGEGAFFALLRDFLKTYRYQAACTRDFQKIAEKHLETDLDWFFDQWVMDGGLPVLAWNHAVIQEQGGWAVRLNARQTQKKYRHTIPIYFHFPGGKSVTRAWTIGDETATRTIKVPAKPTAVTLNDNLEALVILAPL